MKAMHVWMAALLTAVSFTARAEGVHSEDQAIRRVCPNPWLAIS